MSGHAFRSFAALAIVIATTACDNVEWRGVQVSFVRAPASSVGASSDSVATPEKPGAFTLPSGPVLYMGTRDSSGVSLVPVGEVQADSLLQFRDEKSAPGYRAAFAREEMAPGSRFTLFSAGVRVGTLTVSDVGTDASFCTPRPRARGVVELVPEASAATRFLALPESFVREADYAPYRPIESDRAQRAAAIDLAAQVIPQLGATWPGSMIDARGDFAVPLMDGRPAVSSTIVFRDQVAVQPAQPTSYSLYLLATPDGEAYRTSYVWYREAAREGKGVPRFFQAMDWDGDGKTEMLLEVLGERSRWTAVVEERGVEWTRTFQDPCGVAAKPVATPAAR